MRHLDPIALCLALFAVACAADADEDGTPDKDDCAPHNPDIFPGADEVCNNDDDDCDGEVDEDATDAKSWYADADGDLYGDPEAETLSCQAPEGLVADNTDCDDSEANSNPGKMEICDDIDNDCDGDVDEDAADASTWYPDDDSDGYGDAFGATLACENPGGYYETGEDCDDSSEDVYPGADEHCNDVDDDCDGDIDEDPVDPTVWYADTDGDGFGAEDRTRAACDQPTGYIAVGGDCDDAREKVNPDAEELHDQRDNDCDSICDEGFINEGDIVITEFHAIPSAVGEPDGEWLEVYNHSEDDVAICGGWTIADDDTDYHEISVDTPVVLEPNDHVVLGYSDDSTVNGDASVSYAYGTDFNLDLADSIVIQFDGELIDEVQYDLEGDWSHCYDTGYSCQLDRRYRSVSSPADTNDNEVNWCHSYSSYGDGDYGTPAETNNNECSGGAS